MAFAARKIGLEFIVVDPDPECPCKGIATKLIQGNHKDPYMMQKLSRQVDVITVETEHVNVKILGNIVKNGIQTLEEDAFILPFPVYPTPETLKIIQGIYIFKMYFKKKDKYHQKCYFAQHGIPIPFTRNIYKKENITDRDILNDVPNFPFVLKTKFGGYDGKGNFSVKQPSDVEQALKNLETKTCMLKILYILQMNWL